MNNKNNKATQGPWNIVLRTPDRQIGESNFQCYSVDTNSGITVAECGAGEANARLISAAPELLEFASLMRDYFENNPQGYEYLRLRCLEVIKKAEGNE